MGKVKCFDVVSELVTEATRQFTPLWKLNEDKYKVLENYCKAVDSLIDEFEGESIDVEIDEISMSVNIALQFYDIVVEAKDHVFYKLSERAMKIRFGQEEDDLTKVEFVFPSLWER